MKLHIRIPLSTISPKLTSHPRSRSMILRPPHNIVLRSMNIRLLTQQRRPFPLIDPLLRHSNEPHKGPNVKRPAVAERPLQDTGHAPVTHLHVGDERHAQRDKHHDGDQTEEAAKILLAEPSDEKDYRASKTLVKRGDLLRPQIPERTRPPTLIPIHKSRAQRTKAQPQEIREQREHVLLTEAPRIQDTQQREAETRSGAAEDREHRDGFREAGVTDAVHAWRVAGEVHGDDRRDET
jgi:hypothetical protein